MVHLQGGAEWRRAAGGLQAVGGCVVGLVNGLHLGALNVATVCNGQCMSALACTEARHRQAGPSRGLNAKQRALREVLQGRQAQEMQDARHRHLAKEKRRRSCITEPCVWESPPMRMWVGAQGFRLYWYTRSWRCAIGVKLSPAVVGIQLCAIDGNIIRESGHADLGRSKSSSLSNAC